MPRSPTFADAPLRVLALGSAAGLRALAGPGTAVRAYLRLDRGWPLGELTDRRLQEYLTLGMSELHLYHLGLLGQQGLATLRAVIDTTKALARA